MRILLTSFAILLITLAACDESVSGTGSSGQPPKAGAAACTAGTPGPAPVGLPELLFSTYLGAHNPPAGHPRPGEDTIRDVAIDAAGNVYVSGGTTNPGFPVTIGAHQVTFGGGEHDIIVAKFSCQGELVWSTFLGGPHYDRSYAIELDAAGNVYVAGRAGAGFPTTPGVLQPSFAGDNAPNGLYGPQDGFVAKFDNDGRRIWATYFGGAGNGFLRDFDVDDAGNVYVTVSEDANSPWITAGAFQTTRLGGNDAIIGKMKPDASALDWCSYVSGSGKEFGTPSVRVDDQGHVYILGGTSSTDMPTTAGSIQPAHAQGGNPWDVALFKFLPDGSDLVYGTYVGGTGNEFTETHGLAVDAQRRAIVGVTTTSTDYPTTLGVLQPSHAGSVNNGGTYGGNYPGDALVVIVSADGATRVAATYFGGSNGEGIEGIDLGPNGEVVIGGATYSTDLPIKNASEAFQATKSGGADQFVAVLKGDLTELLYSTFIGGSGDDFGRSLVTDGVGSVVVGGQTDSRDFPVSSNAYQASHAGGGGAYAFDAALSVFTVAGP